MSIIYNVGLKISAVYLQHEISAVDFEVQPHTGLPCRNVYIIYLFQI